MPKQRPKARQRRSRGKHERRFFQRRWLIQIGLILTCVALAYGVVLDHQVRKEFEGKHWSVPARVYAQPFELYIGKHIHSFRLTAILKESGYLPVSRLTGPGQYRATKTQVDIHTREFSYWDTLEPEKRIRVVLGNQRITKIVDLDRQRSLQSTHLEPQLIGKLFPFHDEDRVLIEYDDIPIALHDALIAVEDRNFYRHFGIDPKGILRSVYVNLLSGRIVQGGSTLTQQLVKNLFLSRERTFLRKLNEVMMAVMLEYHYAKRDIMTAYVNEVYLGQNGAYGIHGFGTAAEFYFSRPLNELNRAQIALLVGLVKGASYYNPRKHPQRALERRNLVLRSMQEEGFISAAEAEKDIAAPLGIKAKPGWGSAKYPAFLDLVRRHLKRDYQKEDLRAEGLAIHTTLDINKQDIAAQQVAARLNRLDKEKGFKAGTLQTAFVLVNPHNGEVLALLGDRHKDKNAFNRALDAKRPIGSLVKPAVYLSALKTPARYHVLSELDNSYFELTQENGERWIPKNYDGETHRRVPLIRSLVNSYNLSTVRLGLDVGLGNVIAVLQRLGIRSDIPRVPSILLGSLELSPYEVTQFYQVIAGGGLHIPLRTIYAVLDRRGNPLRRDEPEIKEAMTPETAFLIQFLLTEVVRSGTAKGMSRALPALMPLAGKTGTTNGLRDSWFAGFGDELLAITWVGRDDNRPAKLTGSSGAMQLFISVMQTLTPAPLDPIVPDGIVWRHYPDMSASAASCHTTKPYPFIKRHTPGHIPCY